jgi:hydroxymethylbilane synthase
VRALRLATRGSALALAQANTVARRLEQAHPGLDTELVEVRTTGDRLTDVPLGPALGQSFFTKEIEDALLAGHAELAVHSCKDLATVLPDGLVLGALLEREDPRDVLVSRDGRTLAELPAGARVATASVRRKAFLALARPDLVLVDLRGNVPTRLAAVEEGRADAVVLAAAGLHRLGLAARVTEYLDPAVVLPAAAQGAVAVQVRADDALTLARVRALDHAATRAAVTAERACLRRLEAGCQAPVGCLAGVDGAREGHLVVRAAVALPDGREDATLEGPAFDAEGLGRRAAETLLRALALESLREAGAWAGPPPLREPAP